MNEAAKLIAAIDNLLMRFDPDQPRDSQGRWTSGGASDAELPGLVSQLTANAGLGFGINTDKAKASLKAGLTEGDVVDFGSGNKAMIGKGTVAFLKGTTKIKDQKWDELDEKHKTALKLKKAFNDSLAGTQMGEIGSAYHK